MAVGTVSWHPSTPRRVGAILVSALLPGAGHVMLGRTGLAAVFAVVPIFSMALVPRLGLAAAVAVLLWRLVAAVHAAFCKPGGRQPTTGKTLVQIALLLVGTLGSTIGHRLVGLRVLSLHGGAARPLQVLVRTMLLCLFLPAMFWDRDGRGLHDKAAGTVIVRT